MDCYVERSASKYLWQLQNFTNMPISQTSNGAKYCHFKILDKISAVMFVHHIACRVSFGHVLKCTAGWERVVAK